MIRTLILEDHALVREGLRLILGGADDVVIVAEAPTLADAVAVDEPVDVILTDLMLPDSAGPRVVGALRAAFPDAGIVVVSMVDAPGDVRLAMSLGARGYVLKEAAATEVLTALRAVAAGGSYVQPSLGAALAQARAPRGSAFKLTERETDVLALIALGHTNAEIADQLTTSERTIESHRRRISQKLGTTTRAGLVRHAMEMGLLDSYRHTD